MHLLEVQKELNKPKEEIIKEIEQQNKEQLLISQKM